MAETMQTVSYRSEKISYRSLDEFCLRLNALGARRIISIRTCLPAYTNFSQWIEVYYEFYA